MSVHTIETKASITPGMVFEILMEVIAWFIKNLKEPRDLPGQVIPYVTDIRRVPWTLVILAPQFGRTDI
jgi:hypothetical protein